MLFFFRIFRCQDYHVSTCFGWQKVNKERWFCAALSNTIVQRSRVVPKKNSNADVVVSEVVGVVIIVHSKNVGAIDPTKFVGNKRLTTLYRAGVDEGVVPTHRKNIKFVIFRLTFCCELNERKGPTQLCASDTTSLIDVIIKATSCKICVAGSCWLGSGG